MMMFLYVARVVLVAFLIATTPFRYSPEHAVANAFILAGWCALLTFYGVRLGAALNVAKAKTNKEI